jgi:hypothetical protein
MNVAIDVSLLSVAGEAIGRIHGSLRLASAPIAGSSIAFLDPKMPVSLPSVDGFDGLVRVSSLQFAANDEADGVLALLEDIVVPSRQDGLILVKFLTDGFGLFFEEYD